MVRSFADLFEVRAGDAALLPKSATGFDRRTGPPLSAVPATGAVTPSVAF